MQDPYLIAIALTAPIWKTPIQTQSVSVKLEDRN